MVTIERITSNDIESLLPLGPDFFAESGLPGEFNPESFSLALSELVLFGGGAGWRLSNNQGLAVAISTKDVATGDLVVNEWIWYVSPEFRGTSHSRNLFRTMEKWARETGAKRFYTGAMDQRLENLYLRKGFTPVERRFVKELQ